MREECGDDAYLSALVDGELSDSDRGRVLAHVDGCPRCAGEVEDVRRVRAELRSLPHRAVPAGLLDAAAREAAVGQGRARRSHAERVALAGLLVAIAFAGSLAWNRSPEPARTVDVPVDSFVTDHVVRTGAGPLPTPDVTEE